MWKTISGIILLLNCFFSQLINSLNVKTFDHSRHEYFAKVYAVEAGETAIVTSTEYPNVSLHHLVGYELEYYHIYSWPETILNINCHIQINDDNNSSDCSTLPYLRFVKPDLNETVCATKNWILNVNEYIKLEYKARNGGSRFKCEVTSKQKQGTAPPDYLSFTYSNFVAPSIKEISSPKAVTCECGIVDTPTSQRIINGKPVEPNYYTWMAQIYYKTTYDDNTTTLTTFCGGSLITSRHVLTAAHCLKVTNQAWDIYVGLQVHNSSNPGIVRRIQKFIYHQNYSGTFYDIGIIVLDADVKFGPLLSPACLTYHQNFTDEYVQVPGWGITHHGFAIFSIYYYSENLLEVPVKIIPENYCTDTRKTEVSKLIHCHYMPNMDSCYGDSGGPLNWFDKSVNKYKVIGLTSTSGNDNSCGTFFPAFDTDVTFFIDWIKEKIAEYGINRDICIPELL